MWHLMKRHPLPMQAFFRHSLVLTYAFPRAVLQPLLPPGLCLDTYEDFGFLAIALVQTEDLRPVGAPRFLGRDFFLSGYRIFTKFTTPQGRQLRGLRILRSDTDSALMAFFGNALTHYHYHQARVSLRHTPSTPAAPSTLEVAIQTRDAAADLQVVVKLNDCDKLPSNSPFPDLETARKFAGPLPFTFDYERQTHSMIVIKGVRKKWDPQPVQVEVRRNTFLETAPFRAAKSRLANAFYINDIPYRWEKGRVEALAEAVSETTENAQDEADLS